MKSPKGMWQGTLKDCDVEDFADQVRDATPKDIVEPRNAFFEVVRDFVSCVREERVPVIRFGEMLNVQKMMDGVYRSAELEKEVAIH